MTAAGHALRIDAFGGGQTVRAVQAAARQVEDVGFDGLWIPEGAAPAFSLAAVAAAATDRLMLGTGIAVAFARSPMVTAQAAWMLAEATEGRFVLGLGTQVKAHVERRYSMPFDPPGPRLREYVQALRAIFAAFAREERLAFAGDHYGFSLLPETWAPDPLPYPAPPIHLAGVRPYMCRMIGEVADGIKVHPLHTVAYLDGLVRPNLVAGAERAGRSADELEVVCPVMTAVADDERSLAEQRERLRERLAFYGSTPGYGVVFDSSGWPGVGERLHELARAGRHEEATALVTDEMVDAMAVTTTWAELPAALVAKYRGRATRLVCYSTLKQWETDPESVDRWRDVVRDVRRLGEDPAGPPAPQARHEPPRRAPDGSR
ncbi:TIGR03617 family F420-dependent LLM class oxidoreductase [Trujillonella endophytica]|uniref:Probable F420-dependent oxidoreductase, MSMEG_2256 family n=1 Tax=Trujillonella endophytica TaxID=673521 RepID=A0A1H8VW73_9ACTN|nr:TIGR03617 family F420-dependent LLM class oxidoreductase [Trujillella endophytica]SEP19487.1 probable F420-dependent oxidoreductase, MSMEG_2256 family [Trujillella endophytica]